MLNLKNIKSAIIFYNYLDEVLEIDNYSAGPSKKLYIKLLCNIAYNHHSLDQHDKVLDVVSKGIHICNQYHSSYLMELLLYRKAIAQYFLQMDGVNKSLSQVRAIMEIKNYHELLDVYVRVTKKKYNIEF